MPYGIAYAGQAIPEDLRRRYAEIADQSARNLNRAPFNFAEHQMELDNPDLLRSYEMARRIGLPEPYFRHAAEGFERGREEFPEGFQRYMNPYQQAVVDRIQEMGARNLRENLLPQLEAQFVGLGQHGGGRHREMMARILRDNQNEIAANQRLALNQGFQSAGQLFNQDRVRQIEAAKQMADLGVARQAAHSLDTAQLSGYGREQLERRNQQLGMAKEDAMRQYLEPVNRLSQHVSNIMGIPVNNLSQSYGVQQAAPAPQPNTAANIGSAALSLLGARLGKKRGGYIPALYR